MIELTWKERVLGLPMCTALVEARLLRNFSDTSSREHCKQNRIHNYNIYPLVKKNPATPESCPVQTFNNKIIITNKMLESLVLDTDSTRVCVREEYSSRVGLHTGSICFFIQNFLNPFFFFFFFCIWLLSVLRGHSFFSSPPQRPMTSWLLNPRFDILLFYLSSWERANISQSMLGAKQGNYWYYFYNVFGMTRSLTGDWTWNFPHSKPALYH